MIRSAPGDTFAISLPSNASTGYRWRVSGAVPETLRLLDHRYLAPSGPPVPGQGGHERWSFRAVAPGCAVVALEYSRLSGTQVARRAVYEVHVRPADAAASPPR